MPTTIFWECFCYATCARLGRWTDGYVFEQTVGAKTPCCVQMVTWVLCISKLVTCRIDIWSWCKLSDWNTSFGQLIVTSTWSTYNSSRFVFLASQRLYLTRLLTACTTWFFLDDLTYTVSQIAAFFWSGQILLDCPMLTSTRNFLWSGDHLEHMRRTVQGNDMRSTV